jgi:hypothetical protein
MRARRTVAMQLGIALGAAVVVAATCNLYASVSNQGGEPAADVEVEGEVETVSHAQYRARPRLQRSDEIAAG